MDVVRECYVLVGQFGRRVLCWVHLIDEADLKADSAEDNLPHVHDFNDDEDEENVCAICTEPLTEGGDVLRLPCNDKHVFHLACMRQWAVVNLSCPLDRKPIPPEALVKLSLFNNVRLHTSIFLEEMLSGASQYLVWTHLIKDFPVNLLSLAISKCSSTWVERIDQSLYTPLPQGDGTPLPGWSRMPVLKAGQVAFHVLLWTAYSSIGYTSLVLHYLLRQTCETHGHRLCTKAIQLGNVGYDYAGTKQLLSKTKLTRIVKGVGFLLGLVIVGREVRRGSQQLATTLLACVNETIPLSTV
jgi:hypothetical protein